MAIATYVLASGSTWDGVALTDATDFSYTESSNSTRLSTDGSRSVGLIVVDQKVITITVNGINQNLLANAKCRCGAKGSLILKGKLRGAGDTTTTAATFTFTEAVLISSSSNTPNEASGTISINFEAYDSDDSNTIIVIS